MGSAERVGRAPAASPPGAKRIDAALIGAHGVGLGAIDAVTRSASRTLLAAALRKAKRLECDVPGPRLLASGLARGHQQTASAYRRHLDGRPAGEARRFFRNRSHARHLIKSVAPTMLVVVAHPPYLRDRDERVYGPGGGLGEGLSLAITRLAATRLASGGRLLLDTGSAICGGVDRFRKLVVARLQTAGLERRYRELDRDVVGEWLLEPACARADRSAAVLVTARRSGRSVASPP